MLIPWLSVFALSAAFAAGVAVATAFTTALVGALALTLPAAALPPKDAALSGPLPLPLPDVDTPCPLAPHPDLTSRAVADEKPPFLPYPFLDSIVLR